MKSIKLVLVSLLWATMLPAMERKHQEEVNGRSNSVLVEEIIINIAKCYEQPEKSKKPIIVSFAGCSSVGKTIFCKKLLSACEKKGIAARLIRLDNFFTRSTKPLGYSLESSEFNNRVGNDSIWQFDHRRVHEVLEKVKEGERCVFEPKYNYETKVIDTISSDYSKVDLVIIEGIYALSGDGRYDFAQYGSLKVFMDADKELLLDWYCQRTKKNKNDLKVDPVAIWDFQEDYKKIIEPSKLNADLILQQNEKREYSLIVPIIERSSEN